MFWIIFPLISSTLYSLSSFVDNFIVDTWCKKIRPQCLKIAYLPLDLAVLIGLLIANYPALVNSFNPTILVFIAAGAINGLAGISYYLAIKKNNTTDVALLSQIQPVITLTLGIMILRQIPTLEQSIAFFLILGAMFLLVMGTGGKLRKVQFSTALLVLVSSICWASSDILFVSAGVHLDFWVSLFWIFFGNTAANALLALCMPSWRRDARSFFHRQPIKKQFSLLAAQITWLIGEIAWRAGMLAVPVALMSVTGSTLQLITTFLLGIILTLIWPKFGLEKLTRKKIAKHALATSMISVAIFLIG